MAVIGNKSPGDPVTAADINAILASLTAEIAIPIYLGSTGWAIPLANTEFLGGSTRRLFLDLTYWAEVRISRGMSASAAASSVLGLEYTTTLTAATSTGWTTLSPTVSAVGVDSKPGAWGTIPVGAKAPVQIRAVGSGGDGTTSGTIQSLVMHLRR